MVYNGVIMVTRFADDNPFKEMAISPLTQSPFRKFDCKEKSAHWWPRGSSRDCSAISTSVGNAVHQQLDSHHVAGSSLMPFTSGTRQYVLLPSSAAGRSTTYAPCASAIPARPTSACAARSAVRRICVGPGDVTSAQPAFYVPTIRNSWGKCKGIF